MANLLWAVAAIHSAISIYLIELDPVECRLASAAWSLGALLWGSWAAWETAGKKV